MVGGKIVTVVVNATRDHGFESPVLREWLPPAIPWTYMDSFVRFISVTIMRTIGDRVLMLQLKPHHVCANVIPARTIEDFSLVPIT
jgi:hypothetical protein